jgi:4-amino-4-deoxy-L-arabinose transferase-like glycosyltransferase
MIAFIKKYPLIVLMIVSLLMLFTHLGLIQTNIMEARNLITAREMVNDGHWIFTTMNGLPRYEKPPLPTWITAFFMLIGGMQNMFILRLPVALVCLLLVYFFYKLIKAFTPGNNQPLNASLILITSFYIFFAGRDNQWDIYTHAFMIACIYFLLKAFNEKHNTSMNVILSGLFFGFSFLSKGPVSFYALFLSFIISYFIVYKKYTARNLKLLLFILLIGLALGFSWPLYVKYFDATAGTALSKQTQNWGNYEVKPFYYYWSFFTQSGLWTIPSFIALMYFYMRKKVKDVKAYTFSFLWTISSLILLSLIPEKKARYTLPILIPLAMNTGFYIQYLLENFHQLKNKVEKILVYLNFGLIAVIGLAVPFAVFLLFKNKIQGGFVFWYVLLLIISFLSAYLIARGIYKKQFAQVFYTTILFMCGIVITLIPLSKIYYTNTHYYDASNLNSIEKKSGIKTYEAGEYVPEIIWSYGKPIPEINSNNSIIMPGDSLFGLLAYPTQSRTFIPAYKNYSFTKIAVVDLNEISPESKGYNKRLVKDYYLVKKLSVK